MDKITDREMERFERSWRLINSTGNLRKKAHLANEIDLGRAKKTPEEQRQADSKRKRIARAMDMDRNRKTYACWLMDARGMDVEHLARMYDNQDRKCQCGLRIRLQLDYAIKKNRIVCLQCNKKVI